MINTPMDVLANYEIRKSKKQKTAFITAVSAYAASRRYSAKVEKGSLGCRNIVIGDPEKAAYLITAHYDTPACMFLPYFITPKCLPIYILYQLLLVAIPVGLGILAGIIVNALTNMPDLSRILGWLVGMGLYLLLILGPANRHTANDNTSGVVTLLEIMATLPENLRHKVCFVLFDLEEAGLLGSAAYRKAHKAATEQQMVINMDCVGDGDTLMLIPSKKLRGDEKMLTMLDTVCGSWGKKSLSLHKKGFVFYPSDQAHFPHGVAVAAFRHSKLFGPYYGRIHTHRDTVLDQTNVNILRAALISLISQHN